MATLLNAVTADTVGSGASHSGNATVWVRGVFDGATVVIQGADEDVDASYVKLDNISTPNPCTHKGKGCTKVAGDGTYFIRAVLEKAGPNTEVTVVTTQS